MSRNLRYRTWNTTLNMTAWEVYERNDEEEYILAYGEHAARPTAINRAKFACAIIDKAGYYGPTVVRLAQITRWAIEFR